MTSHEITTRHWLHHCSSCYNFFLVFIFISLLELTLLTSASAFISETREQQQRDFIGSNVTSPVCGRQPLQRSPRVVGGNDTYDGEFPWTVSVRKNHHHHCGGVIVGKKWILTAAHCVQSRIPSSFVARIGEFDLKRPNYHSRDYAVDKIVIHENYSGLVKSFLSSGADIALLKTEIDIVMDEHAWPVCFPSIDNTYAGEEAVVVGWGKRHEKSEAYSDRLQKDSEMEVQMLVMETGGPLLSKIDDQWSVIGVVSTGIGCARPLLPGLYSRVSSYYKWIEKYTKED